MGVIGACPSPLSFSRCSLRAERSKGGKVAPVSTRFWLSTAAATDARDRAALARAAAAEGRGGAGGRMGCGDP